MILHTDRGDQFHYWDVRQRDTSNSFEAYYMQRKGQVGNEDYYYQMISLPFASASGGNGVWGSVWYQ